MARLVSRTLPDMVALSRNFPVSPAVAMCEGFEAAQRMLVEDSGLDVTSSGASALCATVIGNVLWVGHTGDCRACIGRMVVRRIKPDGTLCVSCAASLTRRTLTTVDCARGRSMCCRAPDLSDDEKEVQGDGIATDERSKKRYSKLIRDVPPVVAQYIRWPERTAVQDEPPPGCERPWQVIAPRPVSRKKHLRGRFRAVAQVAGGLGAARTRQEEIVAAASLREEVRKKTVARHSVSLSHRGTRACVIVTDPTPVFLASEVKSGHDGHTGGINRHNFSAKPQGRFHGSTARGRNVADTHRQGFAGGGCLQEHWCL